VGGRKEQADLHHRRGHVGACSPLPPPPGRQARARRAHRRRACFWRLGGTGRGLHALIPCARRAQDMRAPPVTSRAAGAGHARRAAPYHERLRLVARGGKGHHVVGGAQLRERVLARDRLSRKIEIRVGQCMCMTGSAQGSACARMEPGLSAAGCAPLCTSWEASWSVPAAARRGGRRTQRALADVHTCSAHGTCQCAALRRPQATALPRACRPTLQAPAAMSTAATYRSTRPLAAAPAARASNSPSNCARARAHAGSAVCIAA